MSPNLTLVIVSGVLVAAGVYLLLERSLTRILIGVLLASNGVNVMFLVASGAAGGAPIIGVTPKEEMSDPLPQAMVLTGRSAWVTNRIGCQTSRVSWSTSPRRSCSAQILRISRLAAPNSSDGSLAQARAT